MQVTDIDVEHEFARIEACFDEFEGWALGGPDVLERRAPGVSGWSVAQHIYHAALATDLALGHVRALVAGKGRLIVQEGALDPRAAEVLANDATPRGEAEAPRMVTPDAEVNPDFLAMEQRGNRSVLAGLRASAGEIPAAQGWIPHQILGPLAATHWLRFAALHARHHGAIARDVLAAG